MDTDREYQLKNISQIFRSATRQAVFKRNPKYPGDGIPCICFSDVLDYRYIIRWGKYTNKIEVDETSDLVAEYINAETLVDDGWRLD